MPTMCQIMCICLCSGFASDMENLQDKSEQIGKHRNQATTSASVALVVVVVVLLLEKNLCKFLLLLLFEYQARYVRLPKESHMTN